MFKVGESDETGSRLVAAGRWGGGNEGGTTNGSEISLGMMKAFLN